MQLVRFDPFRELRMLHRRMDNLLNEANSGVSDSTDEDGITASWSPSVDIFEGENEIVLRAELPGLTEDDVEITIDNGRLTVKGEKKFERSETEGEYRRVESRYGAFYRSFALPRTVDRERVEAKFDKGVLNVTLPKSEEAKPQRIEVKVTK